MGGIGGRSSALALDDAVGEQRQAARVGERAALERRARQVAHGVELYPTILDGLAPWARRLEVELPRPI